MDQNKAAVAQLVSTIDADHVKSKNQSDFVQFDGVKTSTIALDAQVERSLFCAGRC